MKKKEVTIDDLAMMVQRGFMETAKKIDLDSLSKSVDKRFNDVDKRFDRMDKRFDKIEKLILSEHKERIEKLEMQVKELRDLIAFN
jgi:archaellum component FlaC